MIATDNAKGFAARMAGRDVPRYEDTEKSFPELKARIEKTLAFLATFRPEEIDGQETKVVTFRLGPNEVTFTGHEYLIQFLLPNFFFHVSIAYAILRQTAWSWVSAITSGPEADKDPVTPDVALFTHHVVVFRGARFAAVQQTCV